MFKPRTAFPLALGAFLAPCALFSPNLSADMATLFSSKDNSLFEEGQLSNAQGSLFAGLTAQDWKRRGLIAFDIASAVPAGSTIENVTLTINASKSKFGGSADLHRILSNWGEGTSDSGDGGIGVPATNGDATWQNTFYSFISPELWNTPGGDFIPDASSSIFVNAGTDNTFFTFPSTALMVQDVQQWLDVGSNFGWLIKGDETRASAIRFDSKESFFPQFKPFLTIQFAPPVQPQWNLDADGSWGDPNNWAGPVPDGPTAIANFLGKITAPRTVTLDGNRTVGNLRFDNSNTYTIAPGGGGTLTIGEPGASGSISTVSGSHLITAKVIFAAATSIDIAANSPLSLGGGIEIGPAQTVTKFGAGLLFISGPQTHQSGAMLVIAEGHVDLFSNAGAPATSTTAASANLSISVGDEASTVTLAASQDLAGLVISYANANAQGVDLASTATEFHSISIHGGDLDSVRSSLFAAINNARSNPGDGIYDSGLHANSQIGIAKLTDDHGDPYVLIRPTVMGDLNLDGAVSISDFIDLAANFNLSGGWQEGDVNGDGSVTIADFIDLASNFNTSYAGGVLPIGESDQQMLSAFASAHGVTLVPEPGAMAVVFLGTVCLLRRRRMR